MPHQSFHSLFPDLAEAETRSIILMDESKEDNLPPGKYTFLELYCNERGCDCRRVMFQVQADFHPKPLAIIAWGWESPEYYAKWMRDDDPKIIAELIGPTLNMISRQSEMADDLLCLTREVLLRDPAYIERIKLHYRLFRRKIEGHSNVFVRRKKKRKKR